MTDQPYSIISVTPDLIQIEVIDIAKFAAEEADALRIGSYLKITDNNRVSVIAIVKSYKIKDFVFPEGGKEGESRSFIVDTQPVGFLDSEGRFRRGGEQIAIPPTNIEIAGREVLELLFERDYAHVPLTFGSMALDRSVSVRLDGDRFFSKHIAVVGSTGSGKSCAVAKILQEGIAPSDSQAERGVLNNSHIVLFDIHGEYPSAFPLANSLDVESIALPYWLMNSEELEEMFIESNEQNSHNQISQFRHAVVENKKRHNQDLQKITYDTPIYFSLEEVVTYISNLNSEVIGKKDQEGFPKLADADGKNSDDSELVRRREERYFEDRLQFVPASTAAATKASNGPFHGEFDRFLRRLETKMDDERLAFLLKPTKKDGSEYGSNDIGDIVKQIVGYSSKRERNITIIDLAGMPFEEVSVVVSLISRLLFEFAFLSRRRSQTGVFKDIPILVVYEEAHKYVPNSSLSKYRSVRASIERIAKEGRKYGISLMIVSQRPSEISETIFSQCNNFVAMRLTNPNDQNYVKRLLPDAISNITDNLPSLERQEAIVIGDAIQVPTLMKIDDLGDSKPSSMDVKVYKEWKEDWCDENFGPLFSKMQRRTED